MYRGKTVGIVIPAFNEAGLIRETLKSAPAFADRIYAVDDGSTDETLSEMRQSAAEDSRIEVIHRDVNKGVGASIVDGYKRALADGMDVVLVMAGDGQMDSRWAGELIDPLVDGRADYVKANRLRKKGYADSMPRFRLIGNYLLSYLTMLASGYWGISDSQNGYTAATSEILAKINLDDVYARYGYCNDLLCKLHNVGARVLDVDVEAKYGKEKSKIRLPLYMLSLSGLLLVFFFRRILHDLRQESSPVRRALHTAFVLGALVSAAVPVTLILMATVTDFLSFSELFLERNASFFLAGLVGTAIFAYASIRTGNGLRKKSNK